jgi:hypothetical protein
MELVNEVSDCLYSPRKLGNHVDTEDIKYGARGASHLDEVAIAGLRVVMTWTAGTRGSKSLTFQAPLCVRPPGQLSYLFCFR